MKQKSRRYAREKVLQAFYAFKISGDSIEKIKNDIFSDIEDEGLLLFCNQLLDYSIDNSELFENLAVSAVDNWDVERIALLDMLIIKICLAEFFYFEDIPPKVSINEAIELAKQYSTRNSGKFVNGVLDALLIRLKKENRIIKSGKGLIATSTSKQKTN
jgi:N utilization substance protein B